MEEGGWVIFHTLEQFFGILLLKEDLRPSRWTFGRKVTLTQTKFKGLTDRSAVSLKFIEKPTRIQQNPVKTAKM